MSDTESYSFPPFRLDVENGVLWREGTLVPVRPKTFAVLRSLVEQAGHVVTRDHLRETIWGKTTVSTQVLRASLWELRQALDDNAVQPRFIETVSGRGWRFIGKVVSDQLSAVPPEEEENQKAKGKNQKAKIEGPSPALSPQPPTPLLVGRDSELAQLHGWLDKALSGERQLVFVTGEPGIGKTALIDVFWQRLEARGWRLAPSPQASSLQPLAPSVSEAHGQCLEHFGPGEAYLPVLEALERLAGAPGQEHVLALLHRYAPMWLVQMPSLLDPREHAELQRHLVGTTRERMLRELAVFLELLTQDSPLVLVLEDLHWADVSTIELLAYVARRCEPARLLILGTYRPTETLTQAQPLRDTMRELLGHHYGMELRLPLLGEDGVATYLTTRFPQAVFPVHFRAFLQQRSGGNPLFLRTILEEFLAQQLLTNGAGGWHLERPLEELPLRIPDTLQQLLTKQSSALSSAEQQVLQVGSVAGAEFSVAVVAAAIAEDLTTVEEQCEGLVRCQAFLRRIGIEEWPDGTVAARYGFAHALYQQLWHEQVTVSRRQQWHQRIGLRKEVAYNGRAAEIATELAVHFEQGHDYQRTVHYRQQAAALAVQRHAPQQALQHFMTAKDLLAYLPDTPDRHRQELHLQLAIGGLLMTLKGYAAPEVEQTYERARQLCTTVEAPPQELFYSLWGLCAFHFIKAELDTAYILAEQLNAKVAELADPAASTMAHLALGMVEHHAGNFMQACGYLAQKVRLLTSSPSVPDLVYFGQDPWIASLCYEAWSLALLGYLDQAQQRIQQALDRARTLDDPFSLVFCHEFACFIAFERGEPYLIAVHTEQFLALATEHAFLLRMATGHVFHGSALVEQQLPEGITEVRQGIAAHASTGATLGQPFYLSFLAEAACRTGQFDEGLAAIDEALARTEHTGERFYEAELYRLKGELVLQSGVRRPKSEVEGGPESRVQSPDSENPSPQPLAPSTQAEVAQEVEGYFFKAIDIARKQQAKSLELRASTSLARLWQQQGKHHAACDMLSEIYGWFTEGFDTKDLQEAKTLLEELHH